ncbi:MAG: nucleoside triphosphate pyrophosphohydrolase, partial [Acidimicrobiia bacterium]
NELRASLTDTDAAAAELGDLLFSVVNLARHLKVDPELALRGAIDRFDSRFREMEAIGDLRGLSLQEMDQRWEQVKRRKAERESR